MLTASSWVISSGGRANDFLLSFFFLPFLPRWVFFFLGALLEGPAAAAEPEAEPGITNGFGAGAAIAVVADRASNGIWNGLKRQDSHQPVEVCHVRRRSMRKRIHQPVAGSRRVGAERQSGSSRGVLYNTFG